GAGASGATPVPPTARRVHEPREVRTPPPAPRPAPRTPPVAASGASGATPAAPPIKVPPVTAIRSKRAAAEPPVKAAPVVPPRVVPGAPPVPVPGEDKPERDPEATRKMTPLEFPFTDPSFTLEAALAGALP